MLLKWNFNPREVVTKVLPITTWSKNYSVETAVCDLVAGVTIALTLVPQSIAYASLAGLEPQYGLYASFIGSFIYAVIGTVPQINIGPTALLSLLTFTYTSGYGVNYAVILCFFGGIVQCIAGIVQLGFLVDYISVPVVSGFTSAAAVTIASSQIKGLFGMKFESESFIDTWYNVFVHLVDVKMSDTLLSLGCICIIFGLQALKEIKSSKADEKPVQGSRSTVQKICWYIAVGRNAAVVILAALIAFLMQNRHLNSNPFILTGNITAGLPSPVVPFLWTNSGNKTESLGKILGTLGSGLAVVPLVGIIANVAIAKAFADGKRVAATQEIVALGICNVIGSFFKSFPVNGSFTRSAVSQASGVRTPAAGFYTGAIIMITLAVLTPYFYFIPKAALSSVIICAVVHMIDIKIVTKLWYINKPDLIPLTTTFIACLAFGIEYGIACGVLVDVILVLFFHSKPGFRLDKHESGPLPPHCSIHLPMTLHFTSAGNLRGKLSNYPELPLLLYCNDVKIIDFTSLENIKSATSGRRILVIGAKPNIMEKFHLSFGKNMISFNDAEENMNAVLKEAIQHEQVLQQVKIQEQELNNIRSNKSSDTQL